MKKTKSWRRIRLSANANMADEEIDLDLDNLDQDIERKNKVEKRITDLSDKVRLTSEERDELKGLLATEQAAKEAAIKERDFYSSFTDATIKYPGANEYKDIIKEKVLSGYSV